MAGKNDKQFEQDETRERDLEVQRGDAERVKGGLLESPARVIEVDEKPMKSEYGI